MNIYLLEAGSRVLGGMAEHSAAKAEQYLKNLGVNVLCNAQVNDYDGLMVKIQNDVQIPAKTLVWAAGVAGIKTAGLDEALYTKGNRIKVNSYNQVEGFTDVYALGDIAYMCEGDYPNGHPQMAQPAIQQAKLLAMNLKRQIKNEPMKPYSYFNKGAMATIGRNQAVVELPFVKFYGFFAWLTWMFVHLMAIVGVKNRLLVFINWFWNYITYDQSLRLIIKPSSKSKA
jgi:NADH dehydrogenase